MIDLYRYFVRTIAVATCAGTSVGILNYMFIETCNIEKNKLIKLHEEKLKELKNETERLKALADR